MCIRCKSGAPKEESSLLVGNYNYGAAEEGLLGTVAVPEMAHFTRGRMTPPAIIHTYIHTTGGGRGGTWEYYDIIHSRILSADRCTNSLKVSNPPNNPLRFRQEPRKGPNGLHNK